MTTLQLMAVRFGQLTLLAWLFMKLITAGHVGMPYWYGHWAWLGLAALATLLLALRWRCCRGWLALPAFVLAGAGAGYMWVVVRSYGLGLAAPPIEWQVFWLYKLEPLLLLGQLMLLLVRQPPLLLTDRIKPPATAGGLRPHAAA